MMGWYDKKYTRFEICRAASFHVTALKVESKYTYRGIRVHTTKDVDHYLMYFGPDVTTWYVSGFTFNWKKFIDEHKLPINASSHANYKKWYRNIYRESYGSYILKKELVFDIDRKEGVPFETVGNAAARLVDVLMDSGFRGVSAIFSGQGGYHVVVDNMEPYIKQFGLELAARTPKAFAYVAIEMAKKVLDTAFSKNFEDRGGDGRTYERFKVDYSPMFPSGIRKMPYTITSSGTVVFPVERRELDRIDDIEYFMPDNLLSKYKIAGRGIPKLYS